MQTTNTPNTTRSEIKRALVLAVTEVLKAKYNLQASCDSLFVYVNDKRGEKWCFCSHDGNWNGSLSSVGFHTVQAEVEFKGADVSEIAARIAREVNTHR